MSLKAVVLAGLASFASAHIVMTSPKPFLGASNDLNNSPLAADGSDFPCKQRPGVYENGDVNEYKAGDKAPLAFKGTAVHGGGSCQVSFTTDLQPDKNSVWKVVHSIEGGCPAKKTAGNLGNDPNAEVPYDYSFIVPKGMEDGDYVVAWSWFNNVGNREMYMNCGAAHVTGGDGSLKWDSLPDLFTANIGNNCATPANTDVKFPNPGQSVESFNEGFSQSADPVGSGCQAKGASPDPKPSDTESTPTQPTKAPDSGSGSGNDETKPEIPGGVFITKPSKSKPTATSTPDTPSNDDSDAPKSPVTMPEIPSDQPEKGAQPEKGDDAPTEDAPEQDEPKTGSPSGDDAPAEGNGPVESGPGGFTAGEACSSEGQWNCVNSSSFQRCASGAWTAIMPLAEGVECQNGQSDSLTMNAKIADKRSLRRAMRTRV